VQSDLLLQDYTIKSRIIASAVSNHKPITLQFQDTPDFGPLPFKFNRLWLQEQEVWEIIAAAWRVWITGTPTFIWEHKLKLVKRALKEWVKTSYSSPSREKELLKAQLEETQSKMEVATITVDIQAMETLIQQKLQKAIRNEEETWRLKSRSMWLKAGDQNTTYFHRQAKAHLV